MSNSIKTDDVIFNFFKQICDEKDDKKEDGDGNEKEKEKEKIEPEDMDDIILEEIDIE